MALNQHSASGTSDLNLAANERTYRGFLLLLKAFAAASAVTLALLYFFLVR